MNNSKYVDLEKSKSYSDLCEDMIALRIRMAFQSEWEESLEKIEAEAEMCPNDFNEENARILKTIDRSIKARALRKVICKTAIRAGKVAAVLLLVFYLGLTTAVATVESVRIALTEFILHINDDYASLELRETGEYIEVPNGWCGSYYPAYIPDGFSAGQAKDYLVKFVDDAGYEILFYEYPNGAYVSVDAKDSELQYTAIDGKMAVISIRGNWTNFYWADDNRIFMIKSNIQTSEIIKIAGSLVST